MKLDEELAGLWSAFEGMSSVEGDDGTFLRPSVEGVSCVSPPPMDGHVCLVCAHLPRYKQYMVHKGPQLQVAAFADSEAFCDAPTVEELMPAKL